ncbi:DNA cytosine methyltransferase [Cellulosimicrobium sp. SJTW-1]|uniref:DNA cytosine methyltransferase n=1 Tax=Cellulosimicrobium sp. SJTW-1 TaxID=3078082 RepID=UPI0039EC9D7B
MQAQYTSLEICAGAGGQALGLEESGFAHVGLVEVDAHACKTLISNRPNWNVITEDLKDWVPDEALKGVTLLSGGVPCPPFSRAGKQLGREDERDLFPQMLALARALEPEAILVENVRGLLSSKFDEYRAELLASFEALGYVACGEAKYHGWQLLNAADFGVPQNRRRALLVLMRPKAAEHFTWPLETERVTVADALLPFLTGWDHAERWAKGADDCAPALVGGSKKHGGADLGPTSAKAAWKKLGVNGMKLADSSPVPSASFTGEPLLTVEMAAAIQGFPADWKFEGSGKTARYRQVGNAFPPPVARAVGKSIIEALEKASAGRSSTTEGEAAA